MTQVKHYKYWIGIGVSTILSLVLVMAGMGKLPVMLLSPTYQTEYLERLLYNSFMPQILLKSVSAVPKWLPWTERILGLLLIASIATKPRVNFSSVLIPAFIANNSWMIGQGLERDHCDGRFGWFRATLQATSALYTDMGMLALVLIILLYYSGNFFTIKTWFLR